jgi:co-chaperonin GroES (HSP10)
MKLSSYKPRGFQILVELATEETKTKGGLYIPSSGDDEKPYFIGKIIHAGEVYKQEGYLPGVHVVAEKSAIKFELIFEDHGKPVYSINIHNVLGSY